MNRFALTLAVVSAAAFALASCSSGPAPTKPRSKEYFSEAVYGKASPRVVADGQPVPKGGGRFVLGKPYRVAGKTYIPRDNPNYTATGLASWYGEAFHGRLTANGEIYDVRGLTAAHPTMPLPSYARVTNTANGRSLIVRVNDRGPFHRNRVIDVSKAVADMLGFRAAGTAKVRVEYMGRADMDGLDHNKLLASYREGGGSPAFGERWQAPVLVAGAPAPRLRPVPAYQQLPMGGDPMLLTPAGLSGGDPLAPLIMRTSFANGYAPEPIPTPAQTAIEAFAPSESAGLDLQAALERAAALKARELALIGSTTVQIGTFSDPVNAARAADAFGHFGTVERLDQHSDDRTLTIVRIVTAPCVSADAVISAASEAGLSGAFVVR
jgi:rare lipoprotein A